MRACRQFSNDLLVAAMYPIEDANRKPAILKIELVN
jgi:hypothetical protein